MTTAPTPTTTLVTLTGCDDDFTFVVDTTAEQIAFLETLCAATKKASGCEPRMSYRHYTRTEWQDIEAVARRIVNLSPSCDDLDDLATLVEDINDGDGWAFDDGSHHSLRDYELEQAYALARRWMLP